MGGAAVLVSSYTLSSGCGRGRGRGSNSHAPTSNSNKEAGTRCALLTVTRMSDQVVSLHKCTVGVSGITRHTCLC